MVPYRMRGSDAGFNFAFAYALALYLPVGVYIAMNDERFYWNIVRENTELGGFEELQRKLTEQSHLPPPSRHLS